MPTIVLPFPPSVNHYYRTVNNRVLISKEGRKYKDQVMGLAIIAGVVRPDRQNRMRVVIDVSPPDARRRDLDNLQKATLDSLSGVIWGDDSQIDDLRIIRRSPVAGGSITVRAELINEE